MRNALNMAVGSVFEDWGVCDLQTYCPDCFSMKLSDSIIIRHF